MASPANTGRARVPDDPPSSDTSESSSTTTNYFRIKLQIQHISKGHKNEYNGSQDDPSTGPFHNVEVIKIRMVQSVQQLFDEIAYTISASNLDEGDNGQQMEVYEMGELIPGSPRNEVHAMYIYWGGFTPFGDGKGMFTRVHDGNVKDILECLFERPECNDLVVLFVDP